MKKFLIVLFSLLLLTPGFALAQSQLVIATLNTNKAINESNEGREMQKLLLAQKRQTENYIQTKVQELKIKQEELQKSVMLTEKAKKEKFAELQKMYVGIQREKSKTDREFRASEKRYLDTILARMKPVIGKIAKDQNFDMVVDESIVKGILYHSLNIVDVTDQVIAEFNKLKKGK